MALTVTIFDALDIRLHGGFGDERRSAIQVRDVGGGASNCLWEETNPKNISTSVETAITGFFLFAKEKKIKEKNNSQNH